MRRPLFKNYEKKPLTNIGNGERRLTAPSKYYLFVQERWAKKMEAIASRSSRRKLVCSLALFVILGGGGCIYSIADSFFSADRNIIRIIAISKPMDIINKSDTINPSHLSISHKKFDRIIHFRRYMDSLSRSPSGKRAFDSINALRPGLMDSLVFIENYYKSNRKN